jgi:hypothetical protein
MPVFTTRKSDEAAAAQAHLLQQQIAELQSAASQNATHIKDLAEQLQKTVVALELGASLAESRFRADSCALHRSNNCAMYRIMRFVRCIIRAIAHQCCPCIVEPLVLLKSRLNSAC